MNKYEDNVRDAKRKRDLRLKYAKEKRDEVPKLLRMRKITQAQHDRALEEIKEIEKTAGNDVVLAEKDLDDFKKRGSN